MIERRNHKSKEMFVVDQAAVDAVVKLIRGQAVMRKETAEIYFADEIRIYKMDNDAWYVGLYGQADRRKEVDKIV